jgi:hypothetical protein
MSKSAYEVAREAFTVLEFYSDHYASSEPFQQQKAQVAGMLRAKATNQPVATYGRKLLTDLADMIDKS